MGARQGNPRMDFKRRKLHHLPAGEKGSKNPRHTPTDAKEEKSLPKRIPKNSRHIASRLNGNPWRARTIYSHMGSHERLQ
jgi:hypothetical protein